MNLFPRGRPTASLFVQLLTLTGLTLVAAEVISLLLIFNLPPPTPDFYRITAEQIAEQSGFGQVSADKLEGTGFVQYGGIATEKGGDPRNPADPKNHLVAVSGIASAKLYNLCQSMVVKLPVVGETTLRIGAGGGGKPAHADHLVVHTDDLGGDAVFHNIVIGQDASTFEDGSGSLAGVFGQQADTVRIDHLRQSTREVKAATFRLTGLHLTVKAGSKPCY